MKKRSCLLSIASVSLGLVSLIGLGLALFFTNGIGFVADSGGLFILIGFFLGVCTGILSFVGLILGSFGFFYSRPVVAAIGAILNLAVFVRALILLIFFE